MEERRRWARGLGALFLVCGLVLQLGVGAIVFSALGWSEAQSAQQFASQERAFIIAGWSWLAVLLLMVVLGGWALARPPRRSWTLTVCLAAPPLLPMAWVGSLIALAFLTSGSAGDASTVGRCAGSQPQPRVRWCTTIAAGDPAAVPPSSPTVAGDLVYLQSSIGCLALDVRTGQQRWRFADGECGVVSSSNRQWSAPAVADGVVYVGNGDHNLYALDAATGKERWRVATKSFVDSSPVVVAGVVYVGSYDGSLYALDAATGQERWRVATGGEGFSFLATVGGIVYFGNGYHNLYALDAATGKERWRFATKNVDSTPAVADGVVYVGGRDASLYALDAATGKQRWRVATRGALASSPVVVAGVVYVGSYDGNLYALDAATGQERWQFATQGQVLSAPAIVGGVVYVGGGNTLSALDAATGQERWSFNTGDFVDSTPALAGGVVYVGSGNHNLYALDTMITPGGSPVTSTPTGAAVPA